MTAFPMPPLADQEAARQFHRLLMLHLARLKRRGDPVGFHQFLLGQALSLHAPKRQGDLLCEECAQHYPCRTILLLALVTRLPVPWTPTSLGRALSAANLSPSRGSGDLVEDGRLEYGDRTQVDPFYRAERSPRTGRWLVRTYERGGLQAAQHMDDDLELCDFLIEQTLRLAYPYGWKTDPTWTQGLDVGAARALQWWSAHRALPYLESHRSEGAWEPQSL